MVSKSQLIYLLTLFAAGSLFCAESMALTIQQSKPTIVLLSEVPGHSSSELPGIPNSLITDIGWINTSPDGRHWMVAVEFTDTGGATEFAMVLNGEVLARSGVAYPFLPPGREIESFELRQSASVTNAGEAFYMARLDGITPDQECLVQTDSAGGSSILIQRGDPIPGAPTGAQAVILTDPNHTDLGPAFVARNSFSGPSGTETLFMQGTSVFLSTGSFIPQGQFTGLSLGLSPWLGSFYQFFLTPDSTHWMLKAEVAPSLSSMNGMLIVDGTVVLQEGFSIPGTLSDPVDNFGIGWVQLLDTGDWTTTVRLDGQPFQPAGAAVYNGQVVAEAGAPIYTGSSENFELSNFNFCVCNRGGDYVVGNDSDISSGFGQSVIVLNGTEEVYRQNQRVDLDGDGNPFNNQWLSFGLTGSTAKLTDNRLLYLSGRIIGPGGQWGQALYMIDLNGADAGNPFCFQPNNHSAGRSTILGASVGSYPGSGLHLNAQQGPPNQFGYILVATDADFPFALGSGELCFSTLRDCQKKCVSDRRALTSGKG